MVTCLIRDSDSAVAHSRFTLLVTIRLASPLTLGHSLAIPPSLDSAVGERIHPSTKTVFTQPTLPLQDISTEDITYESPFASLSSIMSTTKLTLETSCGTKVEVGSCFHAPSSSVRYADPMRTQRSRRFNAACSSRT